MNPIRSCSLVCLATLTFVLSETALAQVSPSDKLCWSENAGWLNWRDAQGGALGVTVLPSLGGPACLKGYVWSENGGWINTGRGPNAPDVSYPPPSLQSGEYFGVNVDAVTRTLSGYAWGEETGWINLGGGALATPARPAMVTFGGRLTGYAWGENVGWINLAGSGPGKLVSFCYTNCDYSDTAPILNVNDFQCFLNRFAAGDLYANCDGSTVPPVLNINDFQCFLNKFAAGCT